MREVKDRVTKSKENRAGKGRKGRRWRQWGGKKSFVSPCLKQVTVFEIIFFSSEKINGYI